MARRRSRYRLLGGGTSYLSPYRFRAVRKGTRGSRKGYIASATGRGLDEVWWKGIRVPWHKGIWHWKTRRGWF
jgi:hypothetical protein